MDLSAYFEEEYETALAGISQGEQQITPEKSDSGPLELTDELHQQFVPFDINKEFIGTFLGSGPEVKFQNTVFGTWLFQDENKKTWYIPKWQSMDQPQTNFSGFSKETPGERIYFITYLGKTQKGHHDLIIFPKKPWS